MWRFYCETNSKGDCAIIAWTNVAPTFGTRTGFACWTPQSLTRLSVGTWNVRHSSRTSRQRNSDEASAPRLFNESVFYDCLFNLKFMLMVQYQLWWSGFKSRCSHSETSWMQTKVSSSLLKRSRDLFFVRAHALKAFCLLASKHISKVLKRIEK